MPQPKKGPRFGGSPDHHKHLVGNLATELIRHGRIRTTKARAKHVQPLAERMITFARRGDLHSRRQASRVIRDQDVVHKLFADVGPAFAQRHGGYTRVLKLGPRKGDGAEMAMIELVEGVTPSGEGGGLTEAPRRRWSLRRRRGGTPSATTQEREEVEASEAAAPAAAPGSAAASPSAPDTEPSGPEADPEEIEARLAAEEERDEEEQDQGSTGPSASGEQPRTAEAEEAGEADEEDGER